MCRYPGCTNKNILLKSTVEHQPTNLQHIHQHTNYIIWVTYSEYRWSFNTRNVTPVIYMSQLKTRIRRISQLTLLPWYLAFFADGATPWRTVSLRAAWASSSWSTPIPATAALCETWWEPTNDSSCNYDNNKTVVVTFFQIQFSSKMELKILYGLFIASLEFRQDRISDAMPYISKAYQMHSFKKYRSQLPW